MMKCLQWFKDLITDTDIDRLQEEFKLHAKKKGGYFMPNHPYYDSNDESVFYVDIEQDGNMTSTVNTFTFSQFVDEKIDDEFNKSILCISEESRVMNHKEKADYSTLLISQINTLIFLNKNADVLHKKEKIHDALTKIVEYISNGGLPPLRDDDDFLDLGRTVFEYKGNSKTQIRFLYNTLVDLNLFDPYNDQFDKFYQILTSTMVANLQPITVSCHNNTAAYILREIEPMFSRLNFRNIGKSGLIYSRLNKKPFSESGLGRYFSSFKHQSDIDDSLKMDIDKALAPLIRKGKI